MRHNVAHHLAGAVLLSLAAGFLLGLPLVSADVRTAVAAPLEARLGVDPDAQVMLLFAGFPGCQGVCPTALAQLATVQTRADETLGRGRLAVVFVNLHLDTGDAAAKRYAQAFHPNFTGVTATTAERGELSALLAQSGNTNVEALSRHRANVYLYRRTSQTWTLDRVFTTPPAADVVLHTLQANVAARR